jgi:hypothetical protein
LNARAWFQNLLSNATCTALRTGTDFELYVALDPLTQRAAAVAVCNRLCTWLRQEEAQLFFAHPS